MTDLPIFQPPEINAETETLTENGRRLALDQAAMVKAHGEANAPAPDPTYNGQPVADVIAGEKQYLAIKDQARREFDMEQQQAELNGKLSESAEVFRDSVLRPGLMPMRQFEQTVRTPIVSGLLFRNTLAWIAGPSGTFKSFVTADLAFRYGSEDFDYHGRRMTHGRALLVIAEGGGAYADRRVAWEKQYDTEVSDRVSIYPRPLQLADTMKEMPALLSILREADEAGEPFGLVVFDTQAMCTVGVDENKSEMNLVINVLHRIREVSGACVLAVHHYGKKKEAGMRGSSMLYAAADTVVSVERQTGAMTVTLSTDGENGKQKDAPAEAEAVSLRMESHPVGLDYFGEPTTSLAAVPADAGGDVTDTGTDTPRVVIPDVTEKQMIYLRGLNFYEKKGTSQSALARYLTHDMGYATDGNLTRNVLVALSKKGLADQPVAKGYWFITPLGLDALLKDEALRTDWTERAAQIRQRVSRGVSEGQEKLTSETSETSGETSIETSSDQGKNLDT